MIESNQSINVYYNNKQNKININLDIKERFIKSFLYINIDATVIEILSKDSIDDTFFSLPYKDCYMDNYDELKNEKIYILQYPQGKFLSISHGKIKNIDQYEFSHLADTKGGSSGSPVFLENTNHIIGLHKSGNKEENENYGDFIFPIINSIKMNGQYNKKIYKNAVYEGDFVNGKREGYGKIIFEDGKYFIGKYLNDKENGKGIYYNKNNTKKYEGYLIDGKREGYGKDIDRNGDCFIGPWKNNLAHGKGKNFDKEGNIFYDGDYFNGKREGFGKYIYENGEYYIGEWKNDYIIKMEN